MSLRTSDISRLKPDTVIWLVALASRLLLLALIGLSTLNLANPLQSRAFNGGDSEQYMRLAENMVEHGAFSLSTAAPFVPDLSRTPGYPVLLAFLYLLAGRQHNPILIVAVQQVISLLNVWLVMRIGKELFTPTVGWLAGLVYALAPATLIFGAVVMSETLFAALLLSSVLLLIRISQTHGWRALSYAVACGLLFALSVYTRPIGLYAAPILALALVIKQGWKKPALRLAFTILVTFVVSVTPWYLRNYMHNHTVIFTSLANKNLLLYNVASIEAQRQGVSWDEAKGHLWLELQARLDELNLDSPSEAEVSQVMGKIAMQHILGDPLSALLYQTTDMLNSFRPGYSMAMLILRDNADHFGREVQEGNLNIIVGSAPHEILIFGLMTIYYAVLYLGVLIGGIVMLWRRQWYTLVICGLLPFWFLYQPGIAGNARFRAPVEGLLALLAAVGLVWIGQQGYRLARRFKAIP